MSDDTSNTAARFGIAASIVTVLAFLGITNIGELRELGPAVIPWWSDAEACAQVSGIDAQYPALETPAANRRHADVLHAAFETASSVELKSILRESADYVLAYAEFQESSTQTDIPDMPLDSVWSYCQKFD